jgi:transposase
MAKYKYYDYSQSVLIPVSFEEQLMSGTLEFAIHTLVETRMDLSIFAGRYKNDETGRSAYDPKVLLKVVLFGYSRGLITSRKLERACQENVVFMALSCGQRPDHSTIAAFVTSMKDEILPLFADVLLVCEEEGLLEGSFFSLDGCKLSSNASVRWSGTISEIKEKKERIERRVKHLMEQQIEADKQVGTKDERSSAKLKKEKQIKRLQNKADRIEQWLKDNGPKIGKQGREIKSNVTDNESATMVGVHGLTQGYNGQALVDSKNQVVVHGEAFGDGQDSDLIEPMLDGAKKTMEVIGSGGDYFQDKTFTADSNYHSPENLKKCDKEKLDAYIPDRRFRTRDPRLQDKQKKRAKRVDRFRLEDFCHNEDTDEYLCPNGKVLKVKDKNYASDGIIYRRYMSVKEDCLGCELKVKCVRRKNAKRKVICVPVGIVPGNLTKAMQDKIDSEEGKRIYARRMAIVEPVFANIRTHKEMNRFTLRGKVKVNIQWLLYCMVHNMGKILKYGPTYGFT